MISLPVFLISTAATSASEFNTFTQSDFFNSVASAIFSAIPVFVKLFLVDALRITFIALGAIATNSRSGEMGLAKK